MNEKDLKQQIVDSLLNQGFVIKGARIEPPKNLTKERLRQLHSLAVQHRTEKSKLGLIRQEQRLLTRFASGTQVDPPQISPKMIEVESGSEDELLFRYASLHWSIPVSSGYGRRLRFIVIDQHNMKLIGILGLGDPVFSLAPRDNWIGWDKEAQRRNLRYVMDAFVLGAVPPYSHLLCGKLIAMLATSDDVRRAFKRKYCGTYSVIRQEKLDARLALITTTSALGRSSIYNRLKHKNRLLFKSVGFTRGSGEFHFTNGLYNAISRYAAEHCEPTAKQVLWGTGFRNRREVLKKCLSQMGLSTEWLYHGVQREIFVVPLARNTCEFLRGKHSELISPSQSSVGELTEFFHNRWLIPRASWDDRYKTWGPEEWRLW